MTRTSPLPDQLIAFQGEPGAYSEVACRTRFPLLSTLPRTSFEDTFAAVVSGQARLAMIPIDNSIAGRVADIHHLLPGSDLQIIGEHFQRINHYLLALPGVTLSELTTVASHVHALSQCRRFIQQHRLVKVVHADTAGAARQLAEDRDRRLGVIASRLAAERYGLEVLAANIEDAEHNTTRFLIMTRETVPVPPPDRPVITSVLFRVSNRPSALYKALGGFATNGVNITKLESYIVDGAFTVAQFYADIEGHPADRLVALALEELEFFSTEVRILGVYPADPFRWENVGRDTSKG